MADDDDDELLFGPAHAPRAAPAKAAPAKAASPGVSPPADAKRLSVKAGSSLDDKIAARRAKLEQQELEAAAASPPKTEAKRPLSDPVPSKPSAAASASALASSAAAKPAPDGRNKAAAAPRPAPVFEPASKKGPMVGKQPVTKIVEAPKPIKAPLPPLEPAGDPADWVTHMTESGEPYYHNKRTGETTWDKPRALLAEGEAAELEGDWVWVMHDEMAWIPGKVVSRYSDGSLEVSEEGEGMSGERRMVKAKEVGPVIPSAKTLNNLTSDLVQLDEVTEPAIIDLLRRRYKRDKIYTSVGDILVAINPFKSTPLFTPLIMQQYASRTQDAMQLPPHPYAVINGSLQDLIEYQSNQSLLISGESGAGKTVTVKVCLEFLSEIAGSDNGVEQQILASNPILEAFGNAKTKRNDNSSRFGKFMEVHLDDESKKIVACTTVHYLLEKSRVVAQAADERNFHIFYYLVTGKVPGYSEVLLLQDRTPESFKFLSADGSPCAEADHHNDEEEASAMNAAFEEMKISEQDKTDVFKVVAAVLHLGDLDFIEHMSTGSKVDPSCVPVLARASELLGVSEDRLEAVLTKHESMQRDGLMTRAFNPAVAGDARNALARHLYGRLFDYLIRRVNQAMDADKVNAERGGTHFIGMLDIFGFEIFDVNSFEQLCINFANEKLQQLFNRHTFTLEERTYEDEGIAFEHIEFHDSQPLLSFLGLGDGRETVRDGVFQILDEQTAVGSGSDEKFMQSVAQKHRDKKALFNDLCKSRTAFKVMHYAGSVEYETKGFVTKNADKLYENIAEAMRSSVNAFVASLFADVSDTSTTPKRAADASPSTPKSKTQASLFMRQLQALEARTNSTFPRYVRCIKPNGFKKPQLFNAPLCLQQLRFAGVFEAVAIRKLGFPFRHTHEHFFSYFKCLAPYDHAKWQAARKLVREGTSVKTAFTALSKRLLADIVAGPVPAAADCRFGKTMVLYRSKENRALEIARLMVINKAASTIQKVVKGRYVRRHLDELFQARDRLIAAIDSRVEAELDREIKLAGALFFKIYECYRAEDVLRSVRHEAKLRPKLQQVLAADPDLDNTFTRLEQLVKEMDSFVQKDELAFSTVKEAAQVRQLTQLCKERRVVKADLQACLDAVATRDSAASIAAMTKALFKASQVASKGANLGGDSYFREEASDVEAEMQRLQKEQALMKRALVLAAKAQIKGEAKHSQPGAVDVAQCQAHIEDMREAVEALESCKPLSLDAAQSLNSLLLLLDLRESFLTALALGEGAPADEPEWRRVEALLRDISGIPAETPGAFAIDPVELEIVGADLALRAAVDDVVMKLRVAIEAVDDEQLSVALDQARVLKMFDHPDESIRAVCADADELLPKVQHVRASLAEALSVVKESLLSKALMDASSIRFGKDPGMLGYDVVLRAQQLFAWVVELTAEAKLAEKVLYTEPSKAIVDGCAEIGLKLPELEALRQMLQLPLENRLLRQRDAAIKTGNYARAVRLSIEAKDVLFSKPESKEDFALYQFPGLKTPEEFSRSFGIHWKKYKETMLKHYNPWFGKIHTSLTVIELPDEEQTKLVRARAPLLFRNIFGVMGDKKVVEVDGLAHELLSDCLTQPALRDEVFCQLMKQLTDNPNPESEARGWNLMAMCLATFPPSRKLEDYLENFLRVKGRRECVLKLHQTRLGGPLREPPSIEVVAKLRARNSTDFWMPGARDSIQLEERIWTQPEKVEQVVLDWRAVRYVPGSEAMSKKPEPGGQAKEVGPHGLSRMPSFMSGPSSSASHRSLGTPQGGGSGKSAAATSGGTPAPSSAAVVKPKRAAPKPVIEPISASGSVPEEPSSPPPPPPLNVRNSKPGRAPPSVPAAPVAAVEPKSAAAAAAAAAAGEGVPARRKTVVGEAPTAKASSPGGSVDPPKRKSVESSKAPPPPPSEAPPPPATAGTRRKSTVEGPPKTESPKRTAEKKLAKPVAPPPPPPPPSSAPPPAAKMASTPFDDLDALDEASVLPPSQPPPPTEEDDELDIL